MLMCYVVFVCLLSVVLRLSMSRRVWNFYKASDPDKMVTKSAVFNFVETKCKKFAFLSCLLCN